MKNLLIPVLLFWCFAGANAQKYHSEHKKIVPVEYKRAIHFYPLALLQVDYTILAGVELRMNPKMAFIPEAGYIFASDYLGTASENGSGPGTGFVVRPSLRFYVNERNTFYVQPQIFFKQVTHRKNGWVGKDCVNGVPGYEELEEYRYRRQIYGGNIIAGSILPMGRQRKNYIDLYFGFGLRSKRSFLVKEPHSCSSINTTTAIGIENGVFPSLPLGFKLIFVL